jgi:hypothetical protein
MWHRSRFARRHPPTIGAARGLAFIAIRSELGGQLGTRESERRERARSGRIE